MIDRTKKGVQQVLLGRSERSHAEFFEVLVCQIRQDAEIDVILGKSLSVLLKPELLKPVRNLLHRGFASGDLP